MKQSTLLVFILFLLSCSVSDLQKRKIHIIDTDWTFRLPNKLTLSDSSFDSNGNMERRLYEEISNNTPLFSIKNPQKGFVRSGLCRDTIEPKQLEANLASVATWYFQVRSLSDDVKVLDTAFTTETVGGLPFKRQYIKYVNLDTKDTMRKYDYYGTLKTDHKKGNLYLVIDIQFTDSTYGSYYLDLLKSSSFSN
ncbi:hypothetical protein [Flavisolibacter tropicus]|uniref:Lipoprotein n=1 Tax=Flavisolibacter tropicus TaxID=1492898 RepID=A0A172TZ81_9BACT|nr:hypothetical protein [Flavisolibacter tropicus]ANE52292.1 hypothetical protein SY85_19185 [Flavisolibacter tropicus]